MMTVFHVPTSRGSTQRSLFRFQLLLVGAFCAVQTVAPKSAGCGDQRSHHNTAPAKLFGPQLFLDDALIDTMNGLTREVRPPVRLPEPVLDSKTFGVTQPYVSVVRDRQTDQFRIWYNHGPAVWHAESADGMHWKNPRVAWDLPRSYGAGLIDDFARHADTGDLGHRADRARRYLFANWQAVRAHEDKPGDDSGMFVGFSPDGFQKGSWDHAMTWIGAQIPVGDEVYFYYGGYARGHKVAPRTERQIGLARMKRDRYAALRAAGEGRLLTRPFVLPSDRLTINADATLGEVDVRLCGADGRPLPNIADAEPIRGDAVATLVHWPSGITALRGQLIRLEFRLRRADLFGFEFYGIPAE